MLRLQVMRAGATLIGLLAAVTAMSCVSPDVKQVGYCRPSEGLRELELSFVDAIDVLVVADNSGSMGDEQGKLVPALAAMVEQIDETAPLEVDLRIGFTTTDMGNVECSGTTPERGRLRLISARDRIGEFCWPKVNPSIPCNAEFIVEQYCPSQVDDALEVLPTPLGPDMDSKIRPWLDRRGGVLNVGGADFAEALGCYALQGVDGCGFESPLEAMHRAIERIEDPNEPMFGFFRHASTKLVLFVTDEADGSARPSLQPLVFDRNLPPEKKVFWSNPQSEIPSSAITWNAGVRCIGDGDPFDDCLPENYGVDGKVLDPADVGESVLFPLERYSDQIAGRVGHEDHWGTDWIVGALVGVPMSYDGETIDIEYRRSQDPQIQEFYGIDSGCMSDSSGGSAQWAVPPVRLRHFATHLYSICEDDYVGAMRDLGRHAALTTHPACYARAVRDVDAEMQGLQFDCSVTGEDRNTGLKFEVPQCETGDAPPGDGSQCWTAREPTSAYCLDQQAALEFELLRTPGVPAPDHVTYTVTCQEVASGCADG